MKYNVKKLFTMAVCHKRKKSKSLISILESKSLLNSGTEQHMMMSGLSLCISVVLRGDQCQCTHRMATVGVLKSVYAGEAPQDLPRVSTENPCNGNLNLYQSAIAPPES